MGKGAIISEVAGPNAGPRAVTVRNARLRGLCVWMAMCMAMLPMQVAAQNTARKPAARAPAKPPTKPEAKAPTRARTPEQPVPSLKLAPSPPADANLQARVAWASEEADRQRASIVKNPYDEQLRLNVAALSVQVMRDIEQALAVGDIATATALRQLIEKKLADTRWRLNWMSQRNMTGGEFALGVMALHGILETRDMAVACQRLAAAWSKGDLDAAYRLAACQKDKQPAQAAALLRSAADAGHLAASEDVGRACLEAKPSDTRCATQYLTAAAAGGRASAKSLLGWMYAQGAGVERNPQLAETLYREAAGAGDVSALNNLGELYETGRGVKTDVARAVEYYRQAAEAGFAPAQFNLGRMYAGGTGVPRDIAAARSWLGRALQAGVQPAKQLLDWLDKQEPAALSR